MKKPSLLVIFLTVFIDLVGFGIVLPLLPIYSQDFGAPGWLIGVIMASYSAMQFFFAPVWGRLSDRIGRRPVLRMTLAGGAVSYITFAIGAGFSGATGLAIFLVSRVLAGICGANITVAQAYIADITPPEKRSKGMGLIGMAFGLGFIFGPAIGSLSHSWFGMSGPGYVAAVFCGLSFALAMFVLPESRRADTEPAPKRPRMEQWKLTLGREGIALLVGVFFLATFGFTCFETTLGLLIEKNFNLDSTTKGGAKMVGYLFAYCGLIGAIIQGGAIGRLVKKFGEPKLISISLIIFSVSMAPLPFIKGQGAWVWVWLLVALALLAIGSSLVRPPVFGMISMLTSRDEQGTTIGVAQSASSLARIVGPIFAGAAYQINVALPYLVCAAITFLTGILAWERLRRIAVVSGAKKTS